MTFLLSRWAAFLFAALLFVSCGDEQAGHGVTPRAPLSADAPPPSRVEVLRAEALRLLAEGRADEARATYERIIAELDPDDLESRHALGFTDFQTDLLGLRLEEGGDPIPEEISFRRGYDFLAAVKEFHRRRWLAEPVEIARAAEAVKAMRTHALRLATDRLYRLGDQVRANIAAEPELKDLNYETIWAAPHLICYSNGESLPEHELMRLPLPQRRAKRDALAEKRRAWRQMLEEKAAVVRAAYDEWMRRFAKRFDLKPLTDEFGGRPDYPMDVRSYPDGVPLVIWIFADHRAFQAFSERYSGGRMPAGVGGYLQPTTGRVFLWDGKASDERVYEVRKLAGRTIRQLEHWFSRQRNMWKAPAARQGFVSEGIVQYLGSIELGPEGKVKFVFLHPTRLANMQAIARQLELRDQEYPVFPIEALSSFGSYQEAVQWAGDHWDLAGAGMMLLYQQSWALAYFMHEYAEGKYRESWLECYRATFDGVTEQKDAVEVLTREFHLRGEDDLKRLNDEWKEFVREDLLKRAE